MFLRCALLSLVVCLAATRPLAAEGPLLANGLKIGEVTTDSAIVWTRLTGPRGDDGAVPGMHGSVRLLVSTLADLTDASEHPAVVVKPESDFTATWKLTKLRPATKYYVRGEARSDEASRAGQPSARLDGSFTTAPPADDWQEVRFAVMSCQGYKDQDDPGGFLIYP